MTIFPSEKSNILILGISKCQYFLRTIKHFDWDLGGPLLNNQNIKIIDLGNVTADFRNPREHYKRAEEVARRIFSSNITLISIGGDHGIPIPIMRALPEDNPVVLIQIDAHMDWRDEVMVKKRAIQVL